MTVQLNKDKELVKKIREKLKTNGGYCPCALTKTDATKCMCEEFRQKIDSGEPCECHCGLYVLINDDDHI